MLKVSSKLGPKVLFYVFLNNDNLILYGNLETKQRCNLQSVYVNHVQIVSRQIQATSKVQTAISLSWKTCV